ncbi:MAG: virulence RhuM family protein [Defluviitaleaceae bacterium]|nr:virulence RhuM family protein [Defluviitaleaceae bacterium]
MNENPLLNGPSKIILYQSLTGDISVDVFFYDETFWLTQKAMGELFEVDRTSISRHLKNIFENGELEEEVVCAEIARTSQHGALAEKTQTKEVKFYNLDAIISVGYRVNSKSATQFRRWSTTTLKEYITKGFILNGEMLKNGKAFGQDYFDELLERVKEIRASERRFYQKVTDIFAECSYDYDPKSNVTDVFFKSVQNKLLFAITGHTAPEIISERADADKPNMGLITWKNAPHGKILQNDVTVSKNYLNQDEMSGLNDIVNMYLDYAENQAKRHKLMSMSDWIARLDAFLQFNEYDLLHNKGSVERKVADDLARTEYKKYRITQDENYISDFDRAVQKELFGNVGIH